MAQKPGGFMVNQRKGCFSIMGKRGSSPYQDERHRFSDE